MQNLQPVWMKTFPFQDVVYMVVMSRFSLKLALGTCVDFLGLAQSFVRSISLASVEVAARPYRSWSVTDPDSLISFIRNRLTVFCEMYWSG